MPQATAISVPKLKQGYWSRETMGVYTLEAVRRARPLPRFVQEKDRTDAYDLGRTRYFYDLLSRGADTEPIEVSCWNLKGTKWVAVDDGHHRYAAYVLTERLWIPTIVKRGRLPEEYLRGTQCTF